MVIFIVIGIYVLLLILINRLGKDVRKNSTWILVCSVVFIGITIHLATDIASFIRVLVNQ